MTAPFASRSRAEDTLYMQFKRVRSGRSTLDGDATTDVDTGRSPVTRWLTYAFDYADRVSNSGGTAWVINCLVPRGSFIFDCFVRLDEAFDGTGADSVEIGDANQASGYAAAIDLTQDPGTTPLWIRDASGADYTDKTADIVAGTSGGQYYQEGGAVIVVLSTTVPTQGQAILFLASISYNEPQGSEWE